MNEKLVQILKEARHDPKLKQKLIDTKSAKDPMQAFCEVATEAGYEMTVGELFQIGEEYASNLLNVAMGELFTQLTIGEIGMKIFLHH